MGGYEETIDLLETELRGVVDRFAGLPPKSGPGPLTLCR
jgi:hypothetical protein